MSNPYILPTIPSLTGRSTGTSRAAHVRPLTRALDTMARPQRFLLSLILASLMRSVFAAPDYESAIPAIRETVDGLSDQEMAKQSGTINGKNYLATIVSEDHSIFVSIVTPSGSYKPIARADLGNLPYPSIRIENDLVVIQSGYGHHGVYETKYKFRLKNGTFYLTEIRDFANFGADYHDPSIEIITLTVADFERFKAYYWQKRFTIYKDKEEYKPGFRAWSNAMESYKRDFKVPFPPSVSTDLPKHSFGLDGFKFDVASKSVGRAIDRQKKGK